MMKMKSTFHSRQSWLSIFLMLLFSTLGISQTILNEDFEGASHGFTFNNGSSVNKWTVNSGTFFAGAKAMYITNNSANVYSYSITNATVVHAYRTVAIPANTSNVQLSLNALCLGESGFDYFNIWIAPESYQLPAVGTQITSGSNRMKIGSNLSEFNGWTALSGTLDLSAYAGTNIKLIFEWTNDNSLGLQPPVAIDNLLMTKSYCQATTSSPSILFISSTNISGLNTLNNNLNSYASNGYQDFTSLAAVNQYRGNNITGTTTNNIGSRTKIWVDWNDDGDFNDSGEEVFDSGSSTGNVNQSFSFMVPNGVSLGTKRMRIRNFLYTNVAILTYYNKNYTACGNFGSDGLEVWYGEAEDYKINVLDYPNCTSTLSAGTVSISPASGIIGSSFTATATGYTTNQNGLSYQWQKSIDSGATWTNIPGATTPVATIAGHSAAGVTSYRFVVACSYGGSPIASTIINHTTTSITYSGPTTQTPSNTYISSVKVDGTSPNQINNTSTYSSNGYNNFTGLGPATQYAGQDLIFHVTTNDPSRTKIWIDWNKDGDFTDNGESIVDTGISGIYGFSSEVTIPNGTPVGSYRVRIRTSRQLIAIYTYPNFNPEDNFTNGLTPTYGETEDYTISVLPIPNCSGTPVVTVASPATSSGTPNSIFTLTATGMQIPVNGMVYNWQRKNGDNWVDISGATTASSANLTSPLDEGTYQYRLRSTCTNSGLTSYSNIVTRTVALSYCVPSATINPSTVNSTHITGVAFLGTLNDVSNVVDAHSTTSAGYSNYTGLPNKAIQAVGESINIRVNMKERAPLKAWIDWNRDGTFNETTELVYNTLSTGTPQATFGFVIPDGTTPGTYRIRIRNHRIEDLTWDHTTIQPCSTYPTANYGEAEDYNFVVIAKCDAKIASTEDDETCGPGMATIKAVGTAGTTEYRLYENEYGGSSVMVSSSGTFNINANFSKTYWVTAYNGSCESTHRTPISINVRPVPTLEFQMGNDTICGEDYEPVIISAKADRETIHLINEKFESGTLGVFNNVTSGVYTEIHSKWTNRTSAYVPTSPPYAILKPAISSGHSANKFVCSISDLARTLQPIEESLVLTNSVNSTDFLNLNLKYKIYYQPLGGGIENEFAKVQISVDNGANWTTIKTYTSVIGIPNKFAEELISLNDYTNKTNIKIRFICFANSGSNGYYNGVFAIDNVEFYGEKYLDTDFIWTGDISNANLFQDDCTTPYVGEAEASICVKPTNTQLKSSLIWNFTASAVLSNGCSTSGNVSVYNKSKYKDISDTNWQTNNWKPGNTPPTIDNCVVIEKPTILDSETSQGYGKNLLVKLGASLIIQKNNKLTIKDFVKNEASKDDFVIENNASLIQIADMSVNSGQITWKRITNPMNRMGYTYWSSPLDEKLNEITWFSEGVINGTDEFTYTGGNTETVNTIYAWNPHPNSNPALNTIGGQGGWYAYTGVTEPGHGYIIKAPNSARFPNITSTTSQEIINQKRRLEATFTGTPYNGIVDREVVANPGNNDAVFTTAKMSYLGNPYPSAIYIDDFLYDHSDVVIPTIYLWTHDSTPDVGPTGYYYESSDFAIYNPVGGTSVSPNGIKFKGELAAGQGFFIRGTEDGGTVTFRNKYRHNSNDGYNNSNFYKLNTNADSVNESEENEDDEQEPVVIEKHRYWLNLKDNNNQFKQILIGYIQGGTNELDYFDGATYSGGNTTELYTLLEDGNRYTIQGRALPFDDNDTIPLSYEIYYPGSYELSLDEFENLFINQDIYIRDLDLGTEHNLKDSPYEFITEAGNFNDRFVIAYKQQTALNIDQQTSTNNSWIAYSKEGVINIESLNLGFKTIEIYDLLGRKVYQADNVNDKTHKAKIYNANQILIVKITTDDDITSSKKINN